VPPDELGIPRTLHVADALQELATAFDPERMDHLATQRAQRAGVKQEHALVVEPDPTLLGREEQLVGEPGERALPGGASPLPARSHFIRRVIDRQRRFIIS
jgi:hypothetical protein